MKNSTTWLRISYWVGAIADGLVALAMFGEAIFAIPSPLTHYHSASLGQSQACEKARCPADHQRRRAGPHG